jgi:DNA-binding MarR family transcriptional regulator
MNKTQCDTIRTLRAFNRFHTRIFGVLDASFMGSGLSLVEARVLYEVARQEPVLASGIRAELGIDPGYLSRIVARFETRGLIERGRGSDARQRPISLTGAGRRLFDAIDADVYAQVAASIAHLDELQRTALTDALRTAVRLLDRDSSVL